MVRRNRNDKGGRNSKTKEERSKKDDGRRKGVMSEPRNRNIEGKGNLEGRSLK